MISLAGWPALEPCGVAVEAHLGRNVVLLLAGLVDAIARWRGLVVLVEIRTDDPLGTVRSTSVAADEDRLALARPLGFLCSAVEHAVEMRRGDLDIEVLHCPARASVVQPVLEFAALFRVRLIEVPVKLFCNVIDVVPGAAFNETLHFIKDVRIITPA